MYGINEWITKELAKHATINLGSLVDWLETPPDPSLGDLALPCFRLAKEQKKSPQIIATELAQLFEQAPIIERAQAIGPYVNLHLDRTKAMAMWLDALAADRSFFTSPEGTGQVVAIDLSSPNIAKPFSMGHLRSTIIGTALANLAESSEYTVFRINHLGDWGTQFGKMIVAYHRYGDLDAIKQHPISELNQLYVRFHEEAKDHPELEDEARAAFKQLEDGDPKAHELWQWIVDVSLEEFNKTYTLLGTRFTHILGESFYNDKMDAVVTELEERHLLVVSDGAEVVSLDTFNLPPCLIRKSDGATLYATRDLAAALYRHKNLGASRLLYVVGGEQRLHFKQLFHVLELMGYAFAQNCEHVAFGLMKIDGKKMSTRKGQVVRLQDVLDEAIARAEAIISEKNPSLQNAAEVAKAIGVGAVIFNDLKTHRLHDIEFSLDQAVAFDGETGPYVQYTHARACSVLRKAGLLPETDSPAVSVAIHSVLAIEEHSKKDESIQQYANDATWQLAKQISQFPEMRQRALAESDPSLIAKQILDISQAFNRFYHDCPILTASSEVKSWRLALTDATRLTIRHALDLLGILHPEQI